MTTHTQGRDGARTPARAPELGAGEYVGRLDWAGGSPYNVPVHGVISIAPRGLKVRLHGQKGKGIEQFRVSAHGTLRQSGAGYAGFLTTRIRYGTRPVAVFATFRDEDGSIHIDGSDYTIDMTRAAAHMGAKA